jgi:hypothetical protein
VVTMDGVAISIIWLFPKRIAVMEKTMGRILATLLTVLAAGIANGQDQTALGDLMLDLDRLKMQGEKRYTYQETSPGGMKEDVKGNVSFVTEVKDDVVILRDKMELTYRGKKLSFLLVHYCRKNNYLSPTKIESTGEGDDEFGTFVATVEGGKATVTIDGKERVIDLPPDTVSFSALVRLLPLLSREKGTRFSYPHWLESSELGLKKDFMIECLGEEEIARGDQKVLCTKYRLTSNQVMPMDAWIDSDDILQRILMDERKMIDLVQE